MNISPIANFLTNINRPDSQTRNNQNVSVFSYAYSLNADTVSFSGKVRNTDVKDDDWIDDKVMNTDAILKHLENNSYDQVIKFIEDLEDADWDPNYCLFSPDNDDNSLMGIVLEKMADCPENSPEFNSLGRIAKLIATHKDFEYINQSIGQDTLFTALATYNPEVAIDIIYSDDFQAQAEKVDFNKYIALAYDGNMQKVLEELHSMQADYKRVSEEKDGVSKEAPELKENLTVKKLKTDLRRYELNQNPYDPKSLDEVGGMFEAKKNIEEFIIKPWHKDFREKIIENKLNRPSGFLLSGPPGCGKTYIMKAIAAQTGYDLYEINLANIGDSAGYKTQNDLKKLFDNLEEIYKITGEPSIVILDELDSIAMDRKNCQTDWKKDDINALLMVINNSAQRGVIVVGATNDPDSLDSAVKRSGRLDKHIKIGLPDYEETKDIAEKILSNRPIASELLENIDEISKKLKGMSPADISSILHNTCLNAIYEYKDVATMEDFDKMYKALKRDNQSSDRVRVKGFRIEN